MTAGGPPFASIVDAIGWLDDHIDYERFIPDRRDLPTLDRMKEVVRALGNPEKTYPAIHITGTNGKGSTVAMATALLRRAGLAVGTYTSPNLASVNERLAYDAEPISDETFLNVLSHLALVEKTIESTPTRFELLTAAALWWFGDRAIDAAVVEVGLGGTWDCTNVIDGEVAVLTNISFDHTDVLGPTLEGIARDKAGIIKSGSTAVIGETDPGLVELLSAAANEAGASGVLVRDHHFSSTNNRPAVGGRLVDLATPGGHYAEIFVPLHGHHQGENAAAALVAVEAFLGRPLGEDLVAEAFSAVEVPGRLEVVGRRPLCVIDGAHNVAGAAVLAKSLKEEWSVEGPTILVVGLLEGRDPSAMLAPLLGAGIEEVIVTTPRSPRAQEADVVALAARSLGARASVADDVMAAIELARTRAGPDGLVVVAGSLYLVAEARAFCREGSC